MIELFLRNPFRNSLLGDRRYLKYATVHAARLRANNPGGKFDARLAALDAIIEVLSANIRRRYEQGAGRKGDTRANDEAIAKFQKFVGTQAKVLGALFTNLDTGVRGEETAEYAKFFPRGVKVITGANKAEIDAEAAIFLKAALDLKATTGEALLTQATARWKAVTDSRGTQLQTMGDDEGIQEARQAARATLADELFLNLLALLTHHYQEPARVRDYFPQAILKEYRGPADGDGAAPAPAPAP